MPESYFESARSSMYFTLIFLNDFVFMRKIKSKIFQNKFRKPAHKYPTNFSTSNCSMPSFKLSKSKYGISIRRPTLRNNIPTNSKKMQKRVNVLQNSMRKKLPELENETANFYVKLLKIAETLVAVPQKCSLKRCSQSSWYFLGKISGGVSFFLIVMQAASDLSVFALHCRSFISLRLPRFFGWLCLKISSGAASRTTF